MKLNYLFIGKSRVHALNLYSIIFAGLFILLSFSIQAQTTINTTIGSTGYNGSNSSGTNGFITFVVANNSGVPIRITRVGNWATTSHNGTTSTLWYSASSLSGPVTLSGPTWTSIASNVVSGVTAAGVFPVLPVLNFQIPSGTVYRFAVHTTGTNNYTSGTPTPNNFTAAGVTLYTGNHQIAGQNVGYAVTNNPRFFSGLITFEPAFTGSNNAGVSELVAPVPVFCSGNYAVSVKVKNGGVNAINNVRVKWELDNISQPDVILNTPIPVGGNVNVTLSNSVAFGAAQRRIKAWTTMPNGIADTVNTDDTLNVFMGTGLNGVYVVGPTGDFTTVVEAADALNKFGVCGPVTIEITNGTYNGPVRLGNIAGASAVNRITFKSQSGNPSNVTISASPTGTGYVFQLNNASFVTIKDIIIQSNSTNAGRVVEYTGTAANDSLVNCTINSTGVTSSTNSAGVYATSITGTNNVFLNNRINGGYYGIYWEGTSTAVLTQNHVFENNAVTNAYVYSTYFQYTSNLKVRNNTIRAVNSPTTHYGIAGNYNDNALEIINNDIIITGAGTKYGMNLQYCDGTSNTNMGIVLNNTIAIESGTSTAYGIYHYYSNYQNIVNNSVSVNSTSTSTNAGRFYYSSTAYRFNNIINNSFSNVTGNGYTMYIYSTNTAYSNYWDYNNIHSGSNKLVEQGTPAVTYTTLPSWVAASAGNDANSISYDPGYTSTTDLHPNVNNPACWSLNGRGLHIATNAVDKDNNARVTTRPAGVPDIGAYEFTPEVMPPVAVATPSSADPGDTQIFTFGQREVGRVKWGTKGVVSQLEVRQYSGEKGNGIVSAASPFGTMYFHTDITPLGTGSAIDFDLNIDYMDIWLGDIANENELRLAQRVQGYPWMVYSGALSTSNITTNNIDAAQLNRYGSFTGLENGSIPSAFVRANGKVIICVGSTVVLQAEPQNGDFYKWYRNGIEIPGASGVNYKTYTATLAGDYSVAITFSGKIIESVPVTISTIAAPNALINANGPLTYCVGNGLTLNAGTGLGVKYQWQLNGSNIPGATGNTYPVNQAGNYTVVVENIGCSSSSVPTQVNAGPIDVKLGDDTTYCEKKNVWMVLDAGYPGAKYLWNTGDTSKTIEVKQGGTYSVTVDGGPGCVGTDAIVVAIDPLPKANGISFVQNGNTYQFFPSGPVGATGFMWIFSDGTISTVDNPIKTITGDLYVRMVMFNGCGTDTVQLGWPLTVSNVVDEDAIVIFPNPAKDYVSVKIGGSVTVKEITILNSIGAVVSQTNNLDGKQQHTINVSQLPSGHYMLRATTTDGIVNRQFDIIR